MIWFPSNEITDEDAALDWWEFKFAPACKAMEASVDAAALTNSIVASLRAIREHSLGVPISLTEAAVRTGYSADHLGRLVRQGKIRNLGRKGAPRVLAMDLPRRLGYQLAPANAKSYDPVTDARSLRVRR
jgi:hypothetical protein